MTTTPKGNTPPVLFIASDHAGYDLKETLKSRLPHLNWIDCGPANTERVDYPDFADRVAKRVLKEGGRGILVCGSGQGMAMRANKFRGIRAALVWNEESTKLSREHNDANVLCMGARLLDHDLCVKLVEIFLETEFGGGRHQDRVDKLRRFDDDFNC